MFFAADTETTPISEAEPIPQLVSLGLRSPGFRQLYVAHDPACREATIALLHHDSVWAGPVFDMLVLLRAWPDLWPLVEKAYDEGRIHDVQIRQRLLDIAHGDFHAGLKYGLKTLAPRYGLHVDKDDPWRLRYGELLGLPLEAWPADARSYAETDLDVTWDIYAAQATEESLIRDEGNQCRGHFALRLQEIRGICTDQEQRARVDERLRNEYNRAAHIAIAAGLARWQGKANPKLTRSKKAAVKLFVEEYSGGEFTCNDTKTIETGDHSGLFDGCSPRPISAIVRTKSGIIDLSEAELKKLKLPEDHPLMAYQQMGSKQTQRTKLSAYDPPVIRSHYYVPLIETGRTSSRDPNLQNQPRKGGFREILVPRPGYVFVISDWSMAELVTLAQIQLMWFRRSRLADALNAGLDVHIVMGASIEGCSYDSLKAGVKWAKQFEDAPPDDPELARLAKHYVAVRTLAKAPNFGFPGGLGAARFVDFALSNYDIVLSVDEAKRLKRTWLKTWPDMRDYFRVIESWKRADGYYRVQQPVSGRIRGGCTYTEACNSPYQGLAADAAKHTMWQLVKAMANRSSPLSGCHQVLFVHDENVIEAPADRAEEAKHELERIMKAGFLDYCPDVPIGVESKITHRYCK